MSLLSTQSKISRVAASLRTMIRKEDCMPGSKLSSVRQLAQQFGVSPKTVKCAIDILQRESLVRCEHGRGIFVQPQAREGEKEIYILLWGLRREPCNYFEEILKIVYAPVIRPGFSFTVRTVFKDSGDYSSFEQELARIENSPQISCVLASAVQFHAGHFERLGRLPCPVAYFGESKHEDVADFPRNRILDESDWPSACFALLKQMQADEITLFIPDGAIVFFREAARKIIMLASRAGIKLNLFEVPCALYDEFGSDRIRDYYSRTVDKAQREGLLDCPVICSGMLNTIFLQLPQIKKRLATQVPFLEAGIASSHMQPFYDAAFELLEDVIASPAELHTRKICTPVIIEDHAGSQKYLYRDDRIERL